MCTSRGNTPGWMRSNAGRAAMRVFVHGLLHEGNCVASSPLSRQPLLYDVPNRLWSFFGGEVPDVRYDIQR